MTDKSTRRLMVAGLIVSLGIAIGVSQFASGNPDGLEYVAEQEGFLDTVDDHDLADFALADYGEGLTGNSFVNTAVAGLVGVLMTLGVGWIVFRFARRRGEPGPG